jgi:hypothetical protein
MDVPCCVQICTNAIRDPGQWLNNPPRRYPLVVPCLLPLPVFYLGLRPHKVPRPHLDLTVLSTVQVGRAITEATVN